MTGDLKVKKVKKMLNKNLIVKIIPILALKRIKNYLELYWTGSD